jgi:hypothetical protein
MWISSFCKNIYWQNCLSSLFVFSTLKTFIHHRCMGLVLGSQSCCIGKCVLCLYQYHSIFWLLYLCSIFWNQCYVFSFALFVQFPLPPSLPPFLLFPFLSESHFFSLHYHWNIEWEGHEKISTWTTVYWCIHTMPVLRCCTEGLVNVIWSGCSYSWSIKHHLWGCDLESELWGQVPLPWSLSL